MRTADKQRMAWDAKLATYLEYSAILRLPNPPAIQANYHLFPAALVTECARYEGAHAVLAEKLLADVKSIDQLLDSNKSINNAKRFCDVYRRSASALVAMDVNQPILEMEKRALALDPNNHECMNSLAWWLANSPIVSERDPVAALELCERLVQLKPEVTNYRNTLTSIQIRLGNWGEAQEQISRAQQLRKNEWFDAVFAAMIEVHRGDRKLALQLLEKENAPPDTQSPKYPGSFQAKRLLAELELMLQ